MGGVFFERLRESRGPIEEIGWAAELHVAAQLWSKALHMVQVLCVGNGRVCFPQGRHELETVHSLRIILCYRSCK